MHATSVFVALLSAISTASALPQSLPKRDITDGFFNITNFFDGGSPHSVIDRISFTVTDLTAAVPINGVTCSNTSSTKPSIIADVDFPTVCSDPSVTFGLKACSDTEGYCLTISHTYLSNGEGSGNLTDRGTIILGDSTGTWVDTLNPNGNYQYLNHSSAFDIEYLRAIIN